MVTVGKVKTIDDVVVVVVVIAQQLFSYHQLSSLRKSATAAGLSHMSCTVSCVGWL